ncbi:hypothetical protein KY285_019413 [Solanum tuberosum]|nr:hypothetical protein KY285_019413 [Solanum tuberosum]
MGLRKSNPDAYTPMLISIGPYHKRNHELSSMEKYKLLYLQRFLQRKEGLDVESCISALETKKDEALKCYDDNLDNDIVDKFSEMLLLDGCFVVEFIREYYATEEKEEEDQEEEEEEDNDNIINLEWMKKQLTKSKETPKVLGLWDCYHIPSVTELYDAGVRVQRIGYVQEKKEDKTTLFDIKFEKGLMNIPCFAIEDTMETFMRNLIAYEQHSSNKVDVYPYFSNYAHIMTQLIGSHRDVKFLRKEKIILKDIGDDKQVANIFKKLSDGVEITSFYYIKECSKLIQHCDKTSSQMKASLRHNYFSSPWVGASTVAAITLLVLTVIQTVLAFTGDVL